MLVKLLDLHLLAGKGFQVVLGKCTQNLWHWSNLTLDSLAGRLLFLNKERIQWGLLVGRRFSCRGLPSQVSV